MILKKKSVLFFMNLYYIFIPLLGLLFFLASSISVYALALLPGSIEKHFKDTIPNPFINADGSLSATQMADKLHHGNPRVPSHLALWFAQIYIHECLKENINWNIAFSQMLVETSYLNYGHDVHLEQNNFAGMGAYASNKPLSFASIQLGVQAQIQHLKAYGSTSSMAFPIIDPRFAYVKRGSVLTYIGLAGHWAEDPHYAQTLKTVLLSMLKMPPQQPHSQKL